jgi:hypothetical protein
MWQAVARLVRASFASPRTRADRRDCVTHHPGSGGTVPNTQQRLRFVERFELHVAEEDSSPQMAERVFGSLLLTTEQIRSIGSLTGELRASRGATSVAINHLTRRAWVEKTSRTGEREYRLRLVTGEPPERRERLLEIGTFFRLVLDLLPRAVREVIARRIGDLSGRRVSGDVAWTFLDTASSCGACASGCSPGSRRAGWT